LIDLKANNPEMTGKQRLQKARSMCFPQLSSMGSTMAPSIRIKHSHQAVLFHLNLSGGALTLTV